MVQEFERAVIFRLGRLRAGGARGPGVFFVLPCIDTYCKVDLRTVSFDVPPQEVTEPTSYISASASQSGAALVHGRARGSRRGRRRRQAAVRARFPSRT